MKIVRRNGFAILLPFLLISLMGLDGCNQRNRTASPGEVPQDLKIILGLHGAFAGRDMGYTIDGDGGVVRWEGKYPEEHREAEGTIDAEEVRRLWSQAEDIGFLEMQEQVMAATYWFITVSANGESRRVTWVDRNEDAPTPVQEFFEACRDAAQTALGEK